MRTMKTILALIATVEETVMAQPLPASSCCNDQRIHNHSEITMKTTHRSLQRTWLCSALWLLLAALLPRAAQAQSLNTLYSFGHSDGGVPSALIQASDGNLYGTTGQAGAYNGGTVFQITPSGTLTTLHSFSYSEGDMPNAALIQASDGNLYGTTEYGGAHSYGVVFKITTSGTLTTLYSFSDGADGAYPYASLIQASDGNLYGTTEGGGANGYGTVFKITTGGTLTTLHSFNGSDGTNPYSALTQANDGNLYGTTEYNGSNGGQGTVFKITTGGTLTTLHIFSGTGTDGANPYAGLIQASDGNLYGTTYDANSYGGTVFRITTSGTLTTLYSFSGTDGAHPDTSLIQASDGNLYGTTQTVTNGVGTIFKITTGGTLTTLFTFSPTVGYGSAGLIQASDGNLYGTTSSGSAHGVGMVFQMTTGGALTTLYSFSGHSDGANPGAALIQASDGNLYGTTEVGGGANSAGTVFKITTGGALTTLYSFSATGADGGIPSALVQASDGNLYGTTYNGGANNLGTVFKITTSGVLTTLYSFTGGADGEDPDASLIQASDGNLYGTTIYNGANGYGTIFKITTSGTLTTLYSFSYSDGSEP